MYTNVKINYELNIFTSKFAIHTFYSFLECPQLINSEFRI